MRFKQRELFEYRAADTSSCRALGDALRADILGYEPTSTINVIQQREHTLWGWMVSRLRYFLNMVHEEVLVVVVCGEQQLNE